MGQSVETWLVLAALAACIGALLVWMKDAGDDWLAAGDRHWDTAAPVSQRASAGGQDGELPGQQRAGA